MGETMTLIAKRKLEQSPQEIHHIEQMAVAAASDIGREINANDSLPVLTLDQNGSGASLLLEHATAPEIRFAEEDQTDPAGRYRIRCESAGLVIEKALTASWATDIDFFSFDVTNKAFKLVAATEASDESSLELYGASTSSATQGASLYLYGKDNAENSALILKTPNAANDAARNRLKISGDANTAILTLDYVTGITWASNATRSFLYSSASNNATIPVLYLNYVTSTTPANNIGVSLAFLVESSTTTNAQAGTIECIWTNVTHASRVADMIFSIEDDYDNAMEEYFRLDGSAKTILLANNIDINAKNILNTNYLQLDEITTPTAVADHAAIYTKSDNKLYFQDGAGTEHEIVLPDYAGIYAEENSTATTIDLANLWHQVTVFDADMPEVASNGNNSNDNITIGTTADYLVAFNLAISQAAGASKELEWHAFGLSSSGATITGATQANPCVVTATSHGFSNGNRVKIASVVGMTELNGKLYTVANKTTNTFELNDDASANVDSSGYTAYTSGGTATLATMIEQAHAHRELSSGGDKGSASGSGIVSLTATNTLELYVKNIDDTTDITHEALSFWVNRVG